MAAFAFSSGCDGGGSTTTDAGERTDVAADVEADVAPDASTDAETDTRDVGEQPTAAFPELAQLLDDLRSLEDVAARNQRVRTFQREMAYSEDGFPLKGSRDGRPRVTYVLFDSGQASGTLAVAGAFSNWEPRALDQPIGGFPLYVHEADAPAASADQMYKFVRDPGAAEAVWFADPWARRYGHDEFGEFSLVDARPTESHLERWPALDRSAGQLAARELRVYVPPGYDPESSNYPLLVMHDGQNLFAPDAIGGGWGVDESSDAAIRDDGIDPFLVVGIPNSAARMDEYTHVEDSLGGDRIGGRADEYARFVVEGVLPFVQERYAVSTATQDTAILGSSLGGLVSLYIAQQYPDSFGYAGSMSGTLAWGTFGLSNPTILDMYEESPPAQLDIYIDSGGGADVGCDGLHAAEPGTSQDNYCANIAMRDLLLSEGWTNGEDLTYRWDQGAGHNEAAWASRFRPLLRDWFPGR